MKPILLFLEPIPSSVDLLRLRGLTCVIVLPRRPDAQHEPWRHVFPEAWFVWDPHTPSTVPPTILFGPTAPTTPAASVHVSASASCIPHTFVREDIEERGLDFTRVTPATAALALIQCMRRELASSSVAIFSEPDEALAAALAVIGCITIPIPSCATAGHDSRVEPVDWVVCAPPRNRIGEAILHGLGRSRVGVALRMYLYFLDITSSHEQYLRDHRFSKVIVMSRSLAGGPTGRCDNMYTDAWFIWLQLPSGTPPTIEFSC